MIETIATVPDVFRDLFNGDGGQPPVVEEPDRPEREPRAAGWSRINVFLVGAIAALGFVATILEAHRLALGG